jgi:hypothetical protein
MANAARDDTPLRRRCAFHKMNPPFAAGPRFREEAPTYAIRACAVCGNSLARARVNTGVGAPISRSDKNKTARGADFGVLSYGALLGQNDVDAFQREWLRAFQLKRPPAI